VKRIFVFQGGAEAGSTDWKWGVSKSTIQGCIIVFGVAETPAGLVWDRRFPVNQLYPAHPSARGSSV
jgi:hypothetical protein